MNEESLKLIHPIGSYAEISPTGNEVHIIIKAKLGGSGRRTAELEIYASNRRYFTMARKHLDGTPERIEERQQKLDKLLKERFPSEPKTAERSVTPAVGLSDVALIEIAFSAKSGLRFRKLRFSDITDYDCEHSRADAVLCRMLAFWTGGGRDRIDRLLRISGLMREKWNRRWQGDYGARTDRVSSVA